MASHTLLTLPYEMFYEIVKNINGLKNDRRASLINLGNTCRHLRSHVLEILLSSPVVNINKTPLLVYTYWKYPRYLSKTKFLEVQEKPLREKDWIDCFPLENLLPYCEDIIDKTGIHGLPKRIWRQKLRTLEPAAFLGILIAGMTNLETLYLGLTKLRFDPGLFNDYKNRMAHPNSIYLYPLAQDIAPKIKRLEMPTYFFQYRVSHKIFTPFTNLTHLTLDAAMMYLEEDFYPPYIDYDDISLPIFVPETLEELSFRNVERYEIPSITNVLLHLEPQLRRLRKVVLYLRPQISLTQALHPKIKFWEATATIAQEFEKINLEIFIGCHAFNNISKEAIEKMYNRRQRGNFLHLLQSKGYLNGSKDVFHWQRGDGAEGDVFLGPEYWDHIYRTFFKVHKK